MKRFWVKTWILLPSRLQALRGVNPQGTLGSPPQLYTHRRPPERNHHLAFLWAGRGVGGEGRTPHPPAHFLHIIVSDAHPSQILQRPPNVSWPNSTGHRVSWKNMSLPQTHLVITHRLNRTETDKGWQGFSFTEGRNQRKDDCSQWYPVPGRTRTTGPWQCILQPIIQHASNTAFNGRSPGVWG